MSTVPCTDVNDVLAAYDDWTVRLDVQLFYSSLYATIFIVGLIGNGLLIGSMAKRKRVSVPNIFLINLAVSDLLLCITALPITLVLGIFKQWLFGSLMCKMVPLCQGMSALISSYCLCFIAMDRYRNIVTPTREPWTIHHAHIITAIAWAASITVSSPLFVTQRLQTVVLENTTFCGQFCGEYAWHSNPLKIFYGFVLLVCQYVIPATIMTFCYWKILQKVRADWIVTEGSMLTQAQQAQTSIRKRRVMYVLILMVVVFMASWFPLSIGNLLRDLGSDLFDSQVYFKMLGVHVLAMTTIVWNPLLYFWMSKRHRRALKDDMFWLTNVRRQNQLGILTRFAPSPSFNLVYRRTIERHFTHSNYRRGTLADPTCVRNERALADMHANCFLLVPLMPLCQSLQANPHTNCNKDGGQFFIHHR